MFEALEKKAARLRKGHVNGVGGPADAIGDLLRLLNVVIAEPDDFTGLWGEAIQASL